MSVVNQSTSESQALQRKNNTATGVLYGLSPNGHGTDGTEQLRNMTRVNEKAQTQEPSKTQTGAEVEQKKKTDTQLAALELPTDRSRNAAYHGAKLPEIDRREMRAKVAPVVA